MRVIIGHGLIMVMASAGGFVRLASSMSGRTLTV